MRSQHSIDLLGNSQNLQEEGTSCMILSKKRLTSAFCERFESTELPTVTVRSYYKLQTLRILL